jgi:hypothetical protein
MRTLERLLSDRNTIYKEMREDNRWGECRRFRGRVVSNRLNRLADIETKIQHYIDIEKGLKEGK